MSAKKLRQNTFFHVYIHIHIIGTGKRVIFLQFQQFSFCF